MCQRRLLPQAVVGRVIGARFGLHCARVNRIAPGLGKTTREG